MPFFRPVEETFSRGGLNIFQRKRLGRVHWSASAKIQSSKTCHEKLPNWLSAQRQRWETFARMLWSHSKWWISICSHRNRLNKGWLSQPDSVSPGSTHQSPSVFGPKTIPKFLGPAVRGSLRLIFFIDIRWCHHSKHQKTIVETSQIKSSNKNSPNRKLFSLIILTFLHSIFVPFTFSLGSIFLLPNRIPHVGRIKSKII